jgi:hypothetical protein
MGWICRPYRLMRACSPTDLAQLYTAIVAGEDLGPFVHRAFTCGHPELVLASLYGAA